LTLQLIEHVENKSLPALDEPLLALLALRQERDLLAVLVLPSLVARRNRRRMRFLKRKQYFKYAPRGRRTLRGDVGS
jgi:hypothetical protein